MVITRAKEIKSETKTGISEREGKERERERGIRIKGVVERGGGGRGREGADGERDIPRCARVSVILPAG